MTPSPQIDVSGPTARPASWFVCVVKAAVFLAVAFVFAETFWHSLGYVPADSDMMNFARLRRAADGDRTAVALVGSSRVRYGINPQLLERTLPGRHFRQLGILGNGALPVLEDLANDPNFQGLVICEFNPAHWGGGDEYSSAKLPEPLAYMHPEISGAYLETLLGEHFRQWTRFFNYNLFTEGPRILQHKPVPEPERADRFVPFHDLGPTINEPLIRNWEHAALESGERMKRTGSARITQEVQGWVGRIRRRGGDVAFVRMPVDGRLRAVEENVFPQTQSLIRDVRARGMIAIDFADMPGHFRCPDGSHLEASEADRFSRLLAAELSAKSFFRQGTYGKQPAASAN
jgi:hypothetical protein